MRRPLLIVWLVIASLHLTAEILRAADPPVLPHVPENFAIQLVAGPPLVERPVMANFDSRGRLYVVDSAGVNDNFETLQKTVPHRIVVLEDTDGDGRFDRRTLFADKLAMPQGVLPHAGAVYVASPPSVWKLEDTNHDGQADRREALVSKFGSNGNAADVHGPTLGPDGWLYLCDGRHGHHVLLDDGRVDQGLAAGIFRFRTDGSGFERFCGGGFDNPVEIDFTPAGEMVGTVNLLHGNPRQDCLMHWVEGGRYPRADQEQCLAEYPRTGDLLPAISELGHIALSGMTLYRGTALGEDYQGMAFLTVFNQHSLMTARLTPRGSTFASEEREFLTSSDPDFHPTDVLEDADGSLLVINTGGWFRIGCPTSQAAKPDILGGIYRIRRTGAAVPADPRGLALDLPKAPAAKLGEWLDDPRPAVREQALEQLARRPGGPKTALSIISGKPRERSPQARTSAVWAVSRMADPLLRRMRDTQHRSRGAAEKDVAAWLVLQEALHRALRDPDTTVRTAAAQTAGFLRDTDAAELLLARLEGDDPAVQRAAATALGRLLASDPRLHTPRAVTVLAALLDEPETDRFLEHAVILALLRMNNAEAVRPLLSAHSTRSRRAALMVLDQLEHSGLEHSDVLPLLDTEDSALRAEALRTLGRLPGGVESLEPTVAGWLREPELPPDRAQILQPLLTAHLAEPTVQGWVTRALADPATTAAARRLLWTAIEQSTLSDWPAALTPAVEQGLTATDSAERLLVLALLADRPLPETDAAIARLADDSQQPAEVRVAALAARAPRIERLTGPQFELLRAPLHRDGEPLAALLAARALAAAPLSTEQLIALAADLKGVGPLPLPRLLQAFERSQDPAVGQALVAAMQSLTAGGAALPAADEFARLMARYPDSVARQAAPLLAAADHERAARGARLAKIGLVSGPADAERGRTLFFGKKAACSTCHAVADQGGRVGPDLSKIGGIRSGTDLLEAIVEPSASFARDFRPYTITTTAGKTFTGIISRQAADFIELKTAELTEVRIPRASIEELRESDTSIMPKGLDALLTTQDLQDLIAYLQALR